MTYRLTPYCLTKSNIFIYPNNNYYSYIELNNIISNLLFKDNKDHPSVNTSQVSLVPNSGFNTTWFQYNTYTIFSHVYIYTSVYMSSCILKDECV